MHEQIEKSDTGYRGAAKRHRHWFVFNEGDLVWIYFRKEWFTPGTCHKLKQQRIGPCNATETINNNVYCIELQVDLNISNIFNVADLSPFYEVEVHAEDEDKGENLRSSSSRVGENDADDKLDKQWPTWMLMIEHMGSRRIVRCSNVKSVKGPKQPQECSNNRGGIDKTEHCWGLFAICQSLRFCSKKYSKEPVHENQRGPTPFGSPMGVLQPYGTHISRR